MRIGRMGVTLSLAALNAGSIGAQGPTLPDAPSPRFHIEGNVFSSFVNGDQLVDYTPGFGVELFAGPKVGAMSLLVGGSFRGYGRYDANTNAYVGALGIAPRYTVYQRRSRLEPWMGARALLLFQSHRTWYDGSLRSSGVELGFGLGVGFRQSARLSINTEAYFSYLGFGDATVDDIFRPGSGIGGGSMTVGVGLTLYR